MDNKEYIGNPLGYFRKKREALAKAQINNSETPSDVILQKATNYGYGTKMTDKEKLAQHDKKAQRQLNQKNKKGAFKGKKSQSKNYN